METETRGAIIYLSAILAGVVSSGESFEEAQALYAESFRSPKAISVKSDLASFDLMVECLMADIYPAVCSSEYGDDDEHDGGFWGEGVHEGYNEPQPLIKGMTREQAVEAVNAGARFFEICNYKGEGKGLVPEQLGQNLRVFVKKWQYVG